MDKYATSSSGCARQLKAGSGIRVSSWPPRALNAPRYTLVDILVNSFGLIVLSLRTIRRKTRFTDEKRYRPNAPKNKGQEHADESSSVPQHPSGDLTDCGMWLFPDEVVSPSTLLRGRGWKIALSFA